MEARASRKNKIQDGTKKKGKGKVSYSNFEGGDSKVLEHQEDRESVSRTDTTLCGSLNFLRVTLELFDWGRVIKGF